LLQLNVLIFIDLVVAVTIVVSNVIDAAVAPDDVWY